MPKNGPNLVRSVVVGSTSMSQLTWTVSLADKGTGVNVKLGAQKPSSLIRSTRIDCVPESTGSVPDVTTRALAVVVAAVLLPEYIHWRSGSWSRKLPVTKGSEGLT